MLRVACRTEGRQVLDGHFLAGWVEGDGGDLQRLAALGQLPSLLAGGAGHHGRRVGTFPARVLRH